MCSPSCPLRVPEQSQGSPGLLPLLCPGSAQPGCKSGPGCWGSTGAPFAEQSVKAPLLKQRPFCDAENGQTQNFIVHDRIMISGRVGTHVAHFKSKLMLLSFKTLTGRGAHYFNTIQKSTTKDRNRQIHRSIITQGTQLLLISQSLKHMLRSAQAFPSFQTSIPFISRLCCITAIV